MYTACFSIAGWADPQTYIFSGEKLMDIARKFNDVQDITCLAMMAQQMGAEDPDTLDKLLDYAERYQSGKIREKDMEDFDINLSIGSMKCLELGKGQDTAERMTKEYPKAIVR